MKKKYSAMHKLLPVILTILLMLTGLIYVGVRYVVEETYPASEVSILKKWELPEILLEISGIAYMGENKIACVQDEDGIIFIYNLESKAIENQIDFAGPGDYEAITLVDSTAYVLRSDGVLFEVLNFNSPQPQILQYNLDFPSKYNFEGLAYDKMNNRLLLGLKEGAKKGSVPVIAFNLETGDLDKEAIFDFKNLSSNEISGKLRPSEISIHPSTQNIYVLEGVKPRLLLLDPRGNLERIYHLNKKEFRQAEGISFGTNGEIYISNEGKGVPANILQISLKKE